MATGNAKIILSGEHAVLGGARALVWPYGVGAVAKADPRMDRWTVNDVTRHEMDAPLAALFAALGIRMGGRATLCVPAGVGLGVSAALGVAIARAVAPEASEPELRAAAMAWEQCSHGRASGVDVAAAMADQPLLFQIGSPPMSLTASAMDVWIQPVVVEAAPPTADVVARVQRWASVHTVEWRSFCEASDARSQAMRDALECGAVMRLAECMNEAHVGLQHIEVTTPATNAAVMRLLFAGALGAKISGAGGGGLVVALVLNHSLQQVREAAERMGGTVLAAMPLGGTGT